MASNGGGTPFEGKPDMSDVCATAARIALASVLAGAAACTSAASTDPTSRGQIDRSSRAVIRITGSDTMVNLVQAWAERYRIADPHVSIQVAGGGSGVGIAGLIEGLVDIAAAGRQIKRDEIRRASVRNGTEPHEFTVAWDALALYVNQHNPLGTIALDELAEIYGEGGATRRWSQLGVSNAACRRDEIIRVSRQNNSGTYVYFREAVLGPNREYELGSIDQSGSKDVVALVARTPCAIGYSGMAFATAGAKTLRVAVKTGAAAAPPTAAAVLDGSYPLARPLYFYTPGEPPPHTRRFLQWVLGAEGQSIVAQVGFVPVAHRDRGDEVGSAWAGD